MQNRLTELREEKGIPKMTMARILGIPPTTYFLYEIGEEDPPINLAVKIARFYGISVDYLLKLTDDPEPHPRRNGLPQLSDRKESSENTKTE